MGIFHLAVCEDCGDEKWASWDNPEAITNPANNGGWLINDENRGTICNWCSERED